ncbi:transporter substrate-binding domain-containing protein [Teredinibacter sp. KSP-S5-2]|uniref:transporter substrate-binding domain-containing protein n=1 Tax=Teredinibacter sp. KSP-S5-2 TaxID=3034506 RepID=UPI0029348596|nr:transporter substrate-binding domain-containing protein [Teredinibacter sp. KSP-S5-2]WNO08097.1 transporter substrate-binding domain-containing protein [Teredinibacter sp. KSP-S5-2]
MKYWADGMSLGLREYQLEAVKMALDKTIDDYGPYELIHKHSYFSGKRSRQEIEMDGRLNMQFSTGWENGKLISDKVSFILNPYMFGMLGLRRCIIRQEDIHLFKQARTIEDLKEVRIGQGELWPDNQVYIHNKIPLVEVDRYDNLFPMLERGRFDCIALSVLEIDAALTLSHKTNETFVLAPDFYIYYPFNVYLAVSKSRSELTRRMTEGFSRMMSSGDMKKLFKQYFGETLKTHFQSPIHPIFLPNPSFTHIENQKRMENFEFEVLPYFYYLK